MLHKCLTNFRLAAYGAALMTAVGNSGSPVYAGSVNQLCQKQHQIERKQIYADLKSLGKTVPKKLIKPMVSSGKCTLRALKLGITFGTETDFSNAVLIADAMDCLNIRMYEIDQECACRELGLSYEPTVEDDIFKEYKKVRSIERKLLAAGIPNSAIRSYVQNLSVTKDCISKASLKMLTDIGKRLNSLAPIEGGGE